VTFRRSQRASALLLSWNAATGWNGDGKPVTTNGVVGTFTRNSVKRVVDRQGRVVLVARGVPAKHHQYNASTGLWEPVGVLLETSGGNSCLHSEDFTNVAWSKGTGITVTSNDTRAADGNVTGDRLNNDGSVASQSVSQQIAFTDGEKCASVYLKAGTATQTDLLIHDSTDAVTRHGINVAWSGGVPTPTTQAGAGRIYPVQRHTDDWYRIAFSATGIVAANQNRLNIYPTGTGQVAGNVYAWGAQAQMRVAPSSYIPTTTGTGTCSSDALLLPVSWLPRDLTIYVDMVDLGTFQLIGASNLLALGDDDTVLSSSALIRCTAVGDVRVDYDNGTTTTNSDITTGAVAVGDTQEIRAVIRASGIYAGRSINGAAEVVSTPASALAHPSAYDDAFLMLTMTSGVASHAVRSVKIAAGERTMAQMRAAA
jgi:hypothetical protein